MNLIEGAKSFLDEDYSTMDIGIKKAEAILNKISFTEEDVKKFCKNLNELKNSYGKMDYLAGLGIYLSLAVNEVIKEEMEIEIPIKLDFVGMNLEKGKKLVVNGEIRDLGGYELKGGELIINGSAGKNLGNYMEDGYIECEEAEDLVGIEMKGGLIKVNGKTGRLIGHSMDGGKIIVQGFESISPSYKSGTIKSEGKTIKSS